MDRIFAFIILSFFISGILLIPFIDFLYKLKLRRQRQKTRDVFQKRTPIFDRLNDWKVGTPVGGGLLIIFVVTTLSFWTYGLFRLQLKFWEVFVLLFSFLAFGILGFYDDLKKIFNGGKNPFFGLRFIHKFTIQWIIALIIGSIFYFMLGYSFVYMHWIGKIYLGIFYILFASFVIVSFVNAVNITDGLDGLASGVLLICLSAFLVISSTTLDTFLAIFISILIGSIGAFLYFNIYKARIWLGDVGSLSLGAILAVIGLLTGKIAALALIGGIFIIEIITSLIQILGKKYLKRKLLPIAPAHLYFLKIGWEEPKVVMRAWILAFVFAIFGLFIAFSA